MKWVADKTGRFAERPHFEPAELDRACEDLLSDHQGASPSNLTVPIQTNELTKMIEKEAQDLDLYADLSTEGVDVQGVTYFFEASKPRVLIARELTEDPRRENRYRTTLTHELGHAKFHAFIWAMKGQPRRLFDDELEDPSPKCKRGNIIGASREDWMEWQAGYISGSLLMPATLVKKLVSDYFEANGVYGAVTGGSLQATVLIGKLASMFQVSEDAARVRLSQLRWLARKDTGPSLLPS